ncbi:branched-chain amino acid ABC transporter substrate-binding protein [Pseudogulbenkiania ferrooxidans]|uniref:Extracellular ligand-binding receptor n=1 Tax=Pseudogulbenkiania ferrooxidans 2002 TaxID=279714 RepID=B9Z602_9NEIS|nr:branched-chain amino acid ABC transporter substrate-binding protein [Pseudogulbenkiania ferrooxidans]EEG07999.1 Extracellular ligand-binding receptor [Pseudogulbenkiania ferrooxidans 2002]
MKHTLLVTLLALGGISAASAAEVVKIGFIGPLTGPDAHWGKDNQNCAQLAVDTLNRSALRINGQPVQFELVSQDDQEDPKQSTLAAQKLLDEEVKAVVGPFTSGTTIPAARIINQAGLPQFSVAVNATYTNQGYGNAFRLSAVDTRMGPAIAQYALSELKAKRIAMIDDRTAYSQGLADKFEAEAKRLGAQVIRREYTTPGQNNFSPILTTIRAAKPDLLFVAMSDSQAAPLALQMKQLGLSTKVLSGDMIQTDNFIKLSGSNSEGFMAAVAGNVLEKRSQGQDFIKRYHAKYGKPPLSYGPQHYDAVMLVAKAMQQANSTEPGKVTAALKKISYEGVNASYRFDSRGDLIQAPITVYQVRQAKWAPVKVTF